MTPEQRDWILDNVKRTGRYGSYISYFELKELLTANTKAEDECYLVKCDWKTAYLELAKMVDKK